MPKEKKNPPSSRYFPAEGVQIIIPPRKNPIDVISNPFSLSKKIMTPGKGFKPIRPVIDLSVVNFASPHKVRSRFAPAIEVRVLYTDQDVIQAGGIKKLRLGFWNGKKWVRCTPKKHGFKLLPGNWGVVYFKSWGDPTISWGT